MNAQIKAQWVKALLSGAYMPGKGFLATRRPQATAPQTYSALGVLCELAIQAGIQVVKHEQASRWLPFYIETTYDGENLALPPAVAQWADIAPLPWLRLPDGRGISNLAFISGQHDGTFAEIVELIEIYF